MVTITITTARLLKARLLRKLHMDILCNIETERLLLRPLSDEEWIVVVDHVFEASESLIQFGIDVDTFRKEMVEEPYREDVVYFAVVLGVRDDLIGYVGFTPRSNNLEFYVFYEYRREGYAYEAICAFVKAITEGTITGKPQTKIVTQVISDNTACIELMKKLRFSECGCGFDITNGWGFLAFEYVVGVKT